MPQSKKTIYYKNFQIDITPGSSPDGKWKPIWWIWLTEEAKEFSHNIAFSSIEEAIQFAEKMAKEHLDKTA